MDWLFHHRWGKVPGKVGGRPITFITVGGRTTAFVSALQQMTDPEPSVVTGAGAGAGAGPKVRRCRLTR